LLALMLDCPYGGEKTEMYGLGGGRKTALCSLGWKSGAKYALDRETYKAECSRRTKDKTERATATQQRAGHVPRWGRHAYAGRGFRRWKMTMDATMNTFALLSSAAPGMSCATSFTTACATSFTCSSLTCHPRAAWMSACVCYA